MQPHPAAEHFPLMTGTDLAALVADIAAHGQREPIVTTDGMILDGRNRLAACEQAGVAPRFVEWDRRGTPEAFVVSMNLHRRHLSESQRAMIGASFATVKHGEVGGGHERSDGPIGPSALTRQDAASLLNVGRTSIDRAKVVLTKGTPEEIRAVEKGEATVSTIANAIRKGVPAEQRVVALRGTISRGLVDDRGRRYPEKPLDECMDRGLDQLDNTIEIIGTLCARPNAMAHADLDGWTARLEKARLTLSRLINRCRERTAA